MGGVKEAKGEYHQTSVDSSETQICRWRIGKTVPFLIIGSFCLGTLFSICPMPSYRTILIDSLGHRCLSCRRLSLSRWQIRRRPFHSITKLCHCCVHCSSHCCRHLSSYMSCCGLYAVFLVSCPANTLTSRDS